MKKKLLSLALVLVMALTLLPTAAFAADTAGETPPEVNVETPTPDSAAPASASAETPVPPITETPAPVAEVNSDGTVIEGENGSADPAAEQHTHTLTEVPEVPATCAVEGVKRHWHCGACNNDFEVNDITATQVAGDLTIPKTANHDWSDKDGVCKVCGTSCDHSGDTNKTDATCSVCGMAYQSANGCGHFSTRTEVTRGEPTCGAPGYAMASGDKAYYCSECNKYYTDATGGTTVTVTVTLATGRHTRGTVTSNNSSTHTYTCTVCGQSVSEAHTFSSGDQCDYCSYVRGGSTPSPYRYVDISSVYLNNYSISVSWYSDQPEGAGFDIYVDGDRRVADVRPAKSSSGYFSYTVDFSYYLSDSYYTVAVYLHDDHSYYDSTRVYNRYYDDGYYYPDYRPNGTPGTNSYGIPYASQVNGRYSAAEAIRILRGKNQYNLQNDLMNSSSALDSFERLERAVKSANNVSVQVNVDRSDVPSAFRSGISIIGAAFNASNTNSTVRLEVDAPSQTRYVGHGYQFSMTLTGVGGASSLDVPVVVTLPLPSDINSSYVRVLHYHNSSTPTVIVPQVSGRSITFPLTGFSDFVVTDNGAPYGYVSDGYGGYYVPVGNVPRRSLVDEHLAAVLPIIASTPVSGYVFSDVSGTYWAASQIAWARDGGIMTGYYDGTFRPYAGTTRQELWMVLARLSGANPADMWAAREWAMNVGITDGTNPYSPLSNQQMIAMLYRYAQYRRMDLTAPSNLGYYRDGASVSPYARTAMSWATNRGIITGDGSRNLNPQNIATRADFAVYLYRFLQ